MKTLLTTLSVAFALSAGVAQAAGTFVNDYDAMLTGSADSDGSIELAGSPPQHSLPGNFVPSIDYVYVGTPDGDGTHVLRPSITEQHSLPADFVPSIDTQYVGSPDSDGTVIIRSNGRACPLDAARKGIC